MPSRGEAPLGRLEPVELPARTLTAVLPVARPELSVIVLCYQANEAIHRVLNPLYHQLETSDVAYELVLVANQWCDRPDPTATVVEAFAREHDTVRTVIEEKQGAMGWDMRSGLAAAAGDYLVVIDGDAQNPVDDALKMYRRMRATGVEVMKGRRIARFDGPYRRVLSAVYNLLFTLLFGTRGIWDVNGKPKGLTRAAYEVLELESDDWFIDAEIVLSARRHGLAVAELPVVFHRNEDRDSFVRPTAILEFLRNMARQRFRRR
jgi:cellulose synthase/poly-beta-1,6-N-acetylglucosamine synthase-like glycosyltransferase